jgi:hypothetical protein
MPITFTNIAFQSLSLAVLGAFCWMIYAFRAHAAQCLLNLVNFSSGENPWPGSGDKQLNNTFLNLAMSLGAISIGLGAVKFTSSLLTAGTGTPGTIQWRIAGMAGTYGIDGLPHWVAPAAAFAVALLPVVIVLAQASLLKVAGGITLSSKFADAIVNTKKNWLAAASLLIIPPVAMWTGINPLRDQVIGYVIAGVVVALTTLFIIHTLRGFLRQKVSLLVWFLYLCTIEIVPISAVVLVAIKGAAA